MLSLIASAPRVGGIKRRCTSDVCLSVTYFGPKLRTERPRKTKIGTEVAHHSDSDTTFKVKRSNINLQGAGAYCGGLPHSLFTPNADIYREVFHVHETAELVDSCETGKRSSLVVDHT